MLPFLAILAVFLASCNAHCVDDEVPPIERLMARMKTHGTPDMMPGNLYRDRAFELSTGLALSEFDLNEDTGDATFFGWQRFSWTNPHLSWDPEKFDGVDKIIVPSNYIWTPNTDWMLYNSQEIPQQADTGVHAWVKSDGTVIWIPPSKLKARCYAVGKSRYFTRKWDCHMRFGSWVYDSEKLMPQFFGELEAMDLTHLHEHYHGLKIENSGAEVQKKYYPCCEEPFASVYYSFSITKGSNKPFRIMDIGV